MCGTGIQAVTAAAAAADSKEATTTTTTTRTTTLTPPFEDDVIPNLASKRNELKKLSADDRITILKEILGTVEDKDWCSPEQWLLEEARLLGLCDERTKQGIAAGSTNAVPSHVHGVVSLARALMSQHIDSFCNTMIQALEYEQDPTNKLPALLAKKRQTADRQEQQDKQPTKQQDKQQDKQQVVYGPLSLSSAPGHSMEVWCDQHAAIDSTNNSPSSVASTASTSTAVKDAICVVLGAGNQPFLTAVDILHCIFSKQIAYPVLLKHHPLRSHLHGPFKVLFQPLISRGYLHQIKDCGIDATQNYMLSNPLVQHLHVTGSWETSLALERSLSQFRPNKPKAQIQAMLTTELGGVAPFIITPAVYTDKEIRNAAKLAAGSKLLNRGSNCLCTQVILIPKGWPQANQFRQMLIKEIQETPKDPLYYPGTKAKRQAFHQAYSNNDKATVVYANRTTMQDATTTKDPKSSSTDSNNDDDDLVLLECGTPGQDGYNHFALVTEAFGPVLAIVEMANSQQAAAADDAAHEDYLLNTVVPFLNDKSNILGTLVATVIHPNSVPTLPDSFLTNLKYSTVCVNTNSATGYMPSSCGGGRWGGMPFDANNPKGSSGRGWVGNPYSLPSIDKTVVYGSSLAAAPLMDPSSPPPPILFDILHIVTTKANTPLRAGMQILMLLLLNGLRMLVPNVFVALLFGVDTLKPYGAPI